MIDYTYLEMEDSLNLLILLLKRVDSDTSIEVTNDYYLITHPLIDAIKYVANECLIGDDGHAVLGDFGAAAFYDQSNLAVARALEQIEVRAFGCLFEELLERVDCDSGLTDQQRAALQSALELCAQCFEPLVKQRPLFQTIEQRLASLIQQM